MDQRIQQWPGEPNYLHGASNGIRQPVIPGRLCRLLPQRQRWLLALPRGNLLIITFLLLLQRYESIHEGGSNITARIPVGHQIPRDGLQGTNDS